MENSIFSLNSNLMHVVSFGFAIAFAFAAAILNKVRKSPNPLTDVLLRWSPSGWVPLP